MLGELISKVLLVLFGYAMPAFECFKTLETRPDDAHMLRFWCQYWIIVSMVIACESFVSWMPMYGEIKLAFFVYLWYPKTKGSDVVYDSFIRPTVMQYEPNIEQRLEHLRANSGQLIAFYIKNFADKGTAFFMDFLRYVVSERPEAAANSEPHRRQDEREHHGCDGGGSDSWVDVMTAAVGWMRQRQSGALDATTARRRQRMAAVVGRIRLCCLGVHRDLGNPNPVILLVVKGRSLSMRYLEAGDGCAAIRRALGHQNPVFFGGQGRSSAIVAAAFHRELGEPKLDVGGRGRKARSTSGRSTTAVAAGLLLEPVLLAQPGAQRSSWSSWNPFASRRQEPSPPPSAPPRERRFSGADPDDEPPAIADVFRASLGGGAMNRRPHNNNNN
ncbi:hypothetical protein OsI_35181 [Oryza sativa Indica Group]|uniref:HVA22-like protein n=1 Tax=Oryza sativa subsp. indica TaxID=39946 RepID=B8BJ70_ORYSI|nr:hypothetical protein OsI_35181 [Oryza sativa Indica Group]